MDQKAASSLVNLNVDGKLLTCPRDVLVRESDYFRAMFDSNMMESNTKSVTLHGQMKSAIDTCEGYFLTALDDSNCFELADLAKANILHRLYNEAKRHSLFYFQSVRKYPQFLELNAVPLKQYLSSCYLNCKTEIEIVDAINDWLNHDKGSHCLTARAWMKDKSSLGDLSLHMNRSDVLRGKFVNEVWKYDGFHGEWTSLHNFPKSCYDSGMTYTSDRIFVTTPSVYVYTLRTNTWASVCEDKIASEWITTQITPLEYDGDLYLCPKDGFKLCSDCFNVDENEIYRSADGWSVFDLQKYETKLGIQSMTFFNQTYYSVTHDGVLWKGNLFSDRLTLKRLNKEHELIGHYKPIAVPSYPYFKISEDCSNTEDCKTF
ncbi:KLH17-like protein [Mya arenaria]|uniref:KLH17-like protein n=1 Tax=Mya arenaria TaxID=6604 RepID=A0ABY7FQD2_MYAAR|nr:KLH17-like protein [Mya arenaria]